MNLTISQLGDYILVFGAIVVAVTNIINFFSKPTSFFKSRKEKELKRQISDVIDEKIPIILEEHDKELHKRYAEDKTAYVNEARENVLEEIRPVLDELISINKSQNEKIEILARSSKDVLREKIMGIYYKNKKEKQMTTYEKEALTQYHKDYTEQGGNSYITKYMNRMNTWEVYDKDDEL